MVIFNFPRLVFGHFQDALAENRKSLNNYGGMIEVLTYKVGKYFNISFFFKFFLLLFVKS